MKVRARFPWAHQGLMRRVAIAAAIVPLATAPATVWAQSPAYELSGGAISTDQVARGEAAFMTNCSGCHGDDLRSIDSNAPDLRGPSFQYGWVDTPLSEKFEKIASTMPPGMAGSLNDQTYADIMAFILATNGVTPSEGELPGDGEALAAYVLTQP
ncbi:c-type cytochrome [Pelagibacterium sp.]|uniref:c-type cytochrome n=1 Tax=Pelagibacterium sp. TaxID=1967288 RepID=UPI003BACD0F3